MNKKLFKIAKRKAQFLEVVLKRRNISFKIKNPTEEDEGFVLFETDCSNSQFKFAVIRATAEMIAEDEGLVKHVLLAECELKCKDKIFLELNIPEDERDTYFVIPGKKGN